MATDEIERDETEAEDPNKIILPEPEGYKCACFEFIIYRPAIAIDCTVEEAIALIDYGKRNNENVTFYDPSYGQVQVFTPEGLRTIGWVGVTWVPLEQLHAQAITAKKERDEASAERVGIKVVKNQDRENGRRLQRQR